MAFRSLADRFFRVPDYRADELKASDAEARRAVDSVEDCGGNIRATLEHNSRVVLFPAIHNHG